jgi:hypothetical protein
MSSERGTNKFLAVIRIPLSILGGTVMLLFGEQLPFFFIGGESAALSDFFLHTMAFECGWLIPLSVFAVVHDAVCFRQAIKENKPSHEKWITGCSLFIKTLPMAAGTGLFLGGISVSIAGLALPVAWLIFMWAFACDIGLNIARCVQAEPKDRLRIGYDIFVGCATLATLVVLFVAANITPIAPLIITIMAISVTAFHLPLIFNSIRAAFPSGGDDDGSALLSAEDQQKDPKVEGYDPELSILKEFGLDPPQDSSSKSSKQPQMYYDLTSRNGR